jgi:hypothetical protein
MAGWVKILFTYKAIFVMVGVFKVPLVKTGKWYKFQYVFSTISVLKSPGAVVIF